MNALLLRFFSFDLNKFDGPHRTYIYQEQEQGQRSFVAVTHGSN
jgi:hypothetical protein